LHRFLPVMKTKQKTSYANRRSKIRDDW
jgi:hypothetical protein